MLEKTLKDSLELASRFATHLGEQKNTPKRNLANFIEHELTDMPDHMENYEFGKRGSGASATGT